MNYASMYVFIFPEMRVPLVVFVVEGGMQTLEHVTASIENKIPVVVIQGSGKIADVIAECMMGYVSFLALK